MHPVQQFIPFTGNNWINLLAEVHDKLKLEVNAFRGQETEKGVTLRWDYNPTKQLLEVQVMNETWFNLPEIDVDRLVRDTIQSVMFSK